MTETGFLDANGFKIEFCTTCTLIQHFQSVGGSWECRVCHSPLFKSSKSDFEVKISEPIPMSRDLQLNRDNQAELIQRKVSAIFQPTEWTPHANPGKEYKLSSGKFNSDSGRKAVQERWRRWKEKRQIERASALAYQLSHEGKSESDTSSN